MDIPIRFDNDDVTGYQRWNYKWWYALAEFVDNSTHNYYQFRESIDSQLAIDEEHFTVRITVDRDGDDDVIEVFDNAGGMDEDDLADAFDFGRRKADPGRSAYGLGMKTAAIWMGDMFQIETTKLGSPRKLTVVFDVKKVATDGLRTLDVVAEACGEDEHYTKIRVWSLKKRLRGRTVGKVKDYLASIYRCDLRDGTLELTYNGAPIEWTLYDDDSIMRAKDGTMYRQKVSFETSLGNRVKGWFAIFAQGKGGRTKAGFSTIQHGRVIQGYPTSWRPESVFGKEQAGTLVQQRLFGEFEFIGFAISQTKDEILFDNEEESDEIEDHLKQVTHEYKQIAGSTRYSGMGEGPSDAAVQDALDEIGKEIESDIAAGQMVLEPLIPPDVLKAQDHALVERVTESNQPVRVYQVGQLEVHMYFNDVSDHEPYYVNESPDQDRLIMIVNRAHPHWTMLANGEVQAYLRHCVVDGVAEHRVMQLRGQQNVDERTVKQEKDSLLRLRFRLLEEKPLD